MKSEFDIAFFERDLGGSDAPPTPTIPGAGYPEVEDKEEPQCPPGLRKYETMVVLRPDMSEDERLTFTQKYEEVILFIYFFLEYFISVALVFWLVVTCCCWIMF